MKKIEIGRGSEFQHYRSYGSLVNTVDSFLEKAKEPVSHLKDYTIWMINSTAIGGGVAEMLPSQMRLLRELGMKIEWLVIEADDSHFFDLTKRIHNAIHGSGNREFTTEDRKVYEAVNRLNLSKALEYIRDGDLVVIHDPQPLPLGPMIKEHKDVQMIWRCHIGLEEQNDTTRAVWDFLSPYFDIFDHHVFSLESYIPQALKDRSAVISPGIDPLSHKNRSLAMNKCVGILHQSGIVNNKPPVLYPFYEHQVRRVMPDCTFGKVNKNGELDIIWRPIILEISRWDRLKGFKELMDAFILMKNKAESIKDKEGLPYRRIKKTRLILAGPDPKFVSDDPEGNEVLKELMETYKDISPQLQEDIALLLLPMDNQKDNALIVNALQNSASIIVQNSIQEGFGLTATEAMWKSKCVLVSGAAGLVQQVEHNRNGKINPNPRDIESLATTMELMLNSPLDRDMWGFNAQVRVIENFTLFSQLYHWLTLWARLKKSP